jgi:integrase
MSIRRCPAGHPLPTGMYWKNGAYWLVKAGKWHRLGKAYRAALLVYGRMTAAPTGAMAELVRDALPGITDKKADTTKRQYEYAGGQIATLLADFEPAQVTESDIYDLMEQFRETPNMANRVLTVARLIFKHAVKRKLIPNNPCTGVDRFEERKRDRYITDDELVAIREKAGARLQLVIDLLYLTGQRINDVLDIRHGDLTDAGIRFKARKGKERKTVAWNDDLRATVEAAKALRGTVTALAKAEDRYLLRGRWGGRVDYNSLQEQWTRACRLAGVEDAHVHDVRAKSATDAEADGLDPTALLGHTSPAMTARYLRGRRSPVVRGPVLRQAIDKAKNV